MDFRSDELGEVLRIQKIEKLKRRKWVLLSFNSSIYQLLLIKEFFQTTPRPWQFLNFLPLPQGQGSLRPGSFSLTTGWGA